MNGNSEGYFAYGFTLMKGVTCVSAAGDQLVIDVSEMGDPDRAWGFFVTNRDQRSPVERIGSAGQVLPRRATFAKGRFYAEVAASPDKDHRAALRAFVSALEARVPGESRVPGAVAWFPAEGLVPDSIRLVPESVLGLRLLKSGFMAQYPGGRAFVVPEATPEAAKETMAKLRARFAGAEPPSGLGEEAFSAQDPYLGRVLVFRSGARLGGLANVAGGLRPVRPREGASGAAPLAAWAHFEQLRPATARSVSFRGATARRATRNPPTRRRIPRDPARSSPSG